VCFTSRATRSWKHPNLSPSVTQTTWANGPSRSTWRNWRARRRTSERSYLPTYVRSCTACCIAAWSQELPRRPNRRMNCTQRLAQRGSLTVPAKRSDRGCDVESSAVQGHPPVFDCSRAMRCSQQRHWCGSGAVADELPLVLTIGELAKLLHCSRRTVQRLDRANQLPTKLDLPGRPRWTKATILAWLDNVPTRRSRGSRRWSRKGRLFSGTRRTSSRRQASCRSVRRVPTHECGLTHGSAVRSQTPRSRWRRRWA